MKNKTAKCQLKHTFNVPESKNEKHRLRKTEKYLLSATKNFKRNPKRKQRLNNVSNTKNPTNMQK